MEITIKLESKDEVEVFRDILKTLIEGKEKEEFEGNSGKNRVELSQHARWFDDGCVGWTKDAEYNKAFLLHQQKYCNDLLRAKKELYLNEVYDLLGIPRTKAGQIVGWVYYEQNPIGDNFVDFGLDHERNRDFINGYSNTAILDFNVDGDICNLR